MPALVYDIGLHDGGDTAHYLKEGCRVVAIDANPTMCAAAEVRFQDYVRTGQLTIINRGVAECKSQLEFWVCDDVSQWSSFHRDVASRNGAKHHAITVDCVPIGEVIDEFGIADYMKVMTAFALPAYGALPRPATSLWKWIICMEIGILRYSQSLGTIHLK